MLICSSPSALIDVSVFIGAVQNNMKRSDDSDCLYSRLRRGKVRSLPWNQVKPEHPAASPACNSAIGDCGANAVHALLLCAL